MGSEKEAVSTVWDTGSDWSVVEVYDCEGCAGSTYDYRTSDDFYKVLPVK